MDKIATYALLGIFAFMLLSSAALPESTSPTVTPQTPGFEAMLAVGLLPSIIYMMKRRKN